MGVPQVVQPDAGQRVSPEGLAGGRDGCDEPSGEPLGVPHATVEAGQDVGVIAGQCQGQRPLGLEQAQYDELWLLVDNSGDDPLLDRMICETIVISGARQEGILNLELGGIDLEECTIRLDEKFAARAGRLRWLRQRRVRRGGRPAAIRGCRRRRGGRCARGR